VPRILEGKAVLLQSSPTTNWSTTMNLIGRKSKY